MTRLQPWKNNRIQNLLDIGLLTHLSVGVTLPETLSKKISDLKLCPIAAQQL